MMSIKKAIEILEKMKGASADEAGALEVALKVLREEWSQRKAAIDVAEHMARKAAEELFDDDLKRGWEFLRDKFNLDEEDKREVERRLFDEDE